MIDEISNIKERLGKLEARIAAMDLKQTLGDRRLRPPEFTDIVCADCGKTDRINFKPRFPGKLYCRACFEKHKAEKR